MAQLKDDCFAFGGQLTPLADAQAQLAERIQRVVEPEAVAVKDALGRILAEDVVSPRNVPPHDNSAVDGYAVYADDLQDGLETLMPVKGRIAAGHPLDGAADRGAAYRIFTGAPMPLGPDGTQATGPDTVFMEEDVTVENGMARLPAGLKRGSNRRDAGEDVKQGDVIVRAGTKLRPQELGLAASVGCCTLACWRPLKAAIFSTGDEVRDPSDAAPDGCIFDANRYTVGALLKSLGTQVTDLGILPDDQAAIEAALAAAAPDHDVLMTSGGVSAGEEDHVKAAVEALGSLHLWRLAIKPGRPIALGQVKGTAFVGLPGNPVATMVTFMMVARPVLMRLAGLTKTSLARYTVIVGFDMKKKAGRREWARVRVSAGADGRLTAHKDHSSGAGILTSMAAADGLVELGEDQTHITAGDVCAFIPFKEMLT